MKKLLLFTLLFITIVTNGQANSKPFNSLTDKDLKKFTYSENQSVIKIFNKTDNPDVVSQYLEIKNNFLYFHSVIEHKYSKTIRFKKVIFQYDDKKIEYIIPKTNVKSWSLHYFIEESDVIISSDMIVRFKEMLDAKSKIEVTLVGDPEVKFYLSNKEKKYFKRMLELYDKLKK